MRAPSFALLTHREWRAHPWRHVVIVLALGMGVALAWSVHLINASALAEFAAAVRSTQGEPDAVLRGARGPGGGLSDELLDRISADAAVTHAVGVVEIDTYARALPAVDATSDDARVAVRVIGADALTVGALAPSLVPRPAQDSDPMALIDPQRAFLNAAARDALGLRPGARIALQAGSRWRDYLVGGDVAAPGGPLVVIDISAAQDDFDQVGRLSRIDVRLAAGASIPMVSVPLPPGAAWQRADDGEQRVSNLSRAYRVNLMVLALVALLVGAFMAYSVVALAIAQRTPSLALLGVLGMTAGERRALVLRECAWLGAAGSAVGLALGTAMAAWALARLGGDLGGGYFPGVQPALRFDAPAAVAMGALGLVAALVGGFVPARDAQALRPAQALKGLGSIDSGDGRWPLRQARDRRWIGWILLLAGAVLAMLPPVAGVPVAAYASVAALLFAGVALVPSVVELLLRAAPVPTSALGLLALRRAVFHRRTAMAVVAGVVASLALSVALTVMVQSFRGSVAQWLDQVLPADLYLRTGASASLAEQAWLDPSFETKAAAVPGVARVEVARLRAMALSSERPAVTLVARRLAALADPNERLPLVAPARARRHGEVGVYVSEAVERLYGAMPGQMLELPLPTVAGQHGVRVRVLGVWRDFARQFGAVAIDLDDYRALTGDDRVNEMSIWLEPGADVAAVQAALRARAGPDAAIDFATTAELRTVSLRIFDRSFAVTRYLQAVAIVIGLVGIAAGLSAQVLARRKEFGLLTHLGLVRREVLLLVSAETAAWLAAGVVVGVTLGIAIGAILVHVVNPQSFNWTMQMRVPWATIAVLTLAVIAGGVLTAWWSARAVTGRDTVRAVREDW